MRTDGAANRPATKSCLVVNTTVLGLVMKVYVEHVRFLLTHAVTAVVLKRRSYVVISKMKKPASRHRSSPTENPTLRNGLAYSSVKTSANGLWTVANTPVQSLATLRTK
jgi:hypothetical protein